MNTLTHTLFCCLALPLIAGTMSPNPADIRYGDGAAGRQVTKVIRGNGLAGGELCWQKSSPPQYPTPAYHWAMDDDPASGTLADSVGGNPATLSGSSAASVSGKKGTAIDFTGSYGTLATPIPAGDSMTYSFWVKGIGDLQAVMGDAVTVGYIGLPYSGVSGFYVGSGVDIEQVYWDTSLVTWTAWNHFTTVKSYGAVALYINGVFSGEQYLSAMPNVAYLAMAQGEDYKLVGQLDDVMIWTQALTAEQVAALYNSY